MEVKLQRAHVPDLDRLEPLVRAYHAFEMIDSSETLRRSALRRLLSDSTLGAIWLVLADEALAGYLVLCRGFSLEFDGFDAFIDEFFLQAEFRGRGIGGKVLEAIKGEARKLDINALHLEVSRDNGPARRLYAASGFRARDKYLLMTAELEKD